MTDTIFDDLSQVITELKCHRGPAFHANPAQHLKLHGQGLVRGVVEPPVSHGHAADFLELAGLKYSTSRASVSLTPMIFSNASVPVSSEAISNS